MDSAARRPTNADDYRHRFLRVLDFVEGHLDEDLALERLSRVAAFSKYHFQRQFTALIGVGVHRYVQLARLKRASYALAFRSDSILEVALSSRYEGPEAFARAFKKTFGQSPTDFRRKPDWDAWHATYEPFRKQRTEYMKPAFDPTAVKIVDFPETRLAVLEHRGDPARIGDSIQRFIEWRRRHGLHPKVSSTFNVFYNSPTDVAPEDFHCDLCAATTTDVELDPGMAMKSIPAGRAAVLRHTGSDDTLEATLMYLYSKWLPESGEEPRDFPLYFQRITFFPDVPENEAATDIFLPIR